MHLNSLELKNFRIHADKKLNFSNQLNFIIGSNGKGKTSILESIYYLCTTKGFSLRTDSEAVRFNAEGFEINGSFKGLTDDYIRVYYPLFENKKYYFNNGKQVYKSADVIGRYPVVVLTPEDHAITQGAPADRRKFVDSIISQANVNYLKLLLDYNKTLKQRSSLLSQLKENRRRILLDEFDAWTEKLLIAGVQLINYRINFLKEFEYYIKDSYSKIMEADEIPTVTYAYLDEESDENVEAKFKRVLTLKREEELRRGKNLVGPHKDDFIFNINEKSLRIFGSQGQHKTFQVALKFAQFFYLKEITGKKPIFLLDDVFGELDANRAAKISSYLRDVGQAFITITDLANFEFLKLKLEDKVIKLNEGAVEYVI
jgi:DNA replication and repair protein RecF